MIQIHIIMNGIPYKMMICISYILSTHCYNHAYIREQTKHTQGQYNFIAEVIGGGEVELLVFMLHTVGEEEAVRRKKCICWWTTWHY